MQDAEDKRKAERAAKIEEGRRAKQVRLARINPSFCLGEGENHGAMPCRPFYDDHCVRDILSP